MDKLSGKEEIARIKEEEKALMRLLKSPDGKIALHFLEGLFGGNVVIRNDPYATHVRIGERAVVDYLTKLRESES